MHIEQAGLAMKMTLDVPEDLILEAMHLTHSGTKTAVITLALEELVKRSKIADLKSYRGKFAIDIDLDTLRDR